ncbi:uncharacterized protein LOC110973400 [Acanthaster planci]|uniref:Uncharacterized protein LOC110973400 n=1 Tax=Acanthaster planci TaxID=133434 RepID=A0A8B7XGJ9_ACAPL|nr:uncharacterized protein LOC110973400 [Acanthaster planci]
MPEPAVDSIEDRIRKFMLSKRVRVAEFFKDFDNLRSGCVTASQFKRCLDQGFSSILAEAEEELLIEKFKEKDGMVNYKRFADVIECTFQPNNLRVEPKSQTIEPDEFLGTTRSIRPLSPASVQKVNTIIERIAPYYKYHGINISSSYTDFDRHHIGTVTDSQFARSFPRPPGLEDEEVNLLIRRYLDPNTSNLCNYLNFHNDVEAAKERLVENLFDPLPENNYNIPRVEKADDELKELFKRIQIAVHKHGIRTTEFFCDHDKLRSGIITENQFQCGLMLCVGKEAGLTRGEVQRLADYYKQPDSRVRYKEFCHLMENAFNEPHLEKKPETRVYRPPQGHLSRSLNPLNQQEEARVAKILDELASTVQRRRLMCFPHFKDYDRSKAYTRNVTPSQFRRILHFLGINVESEDFKLLCRKFEEPRGGDVNYPAFVQAIDKDFIGFTMDSDHPVEKERPRTPYDQKPIDTSNVNITELLKRIRHDVLVNRVRVCEYFQDFDPLREHSIPRSQFTMGLTAMGQQTLSREESKALCDYYTNPQNPLHVQWKKFEKDIESVFTQVEPDLEKTPTNQVPPLESFLVEKQGTVDWAQATPEQTTIVDQAMDRMRQRSNQRRIHSKPCFQDYDLHNIGVVTKQQFRQCLTFLGLNASEMEMELLELKYSNTMGFNYLRFLDDLQPRDKQDLKYTQRLEELRLVNSKSVSLEKNPLTDFEEIMKKIKIKVSRERMRVLEFIRDYDKLRTGRMLKTTFRRALDLAHLELQASEVDILQQNYEYPRDPAYVEYVPFCDEIESIFTLKHLEKAPQVKPIQFKPPVEVDQNVLDKDSEIILQRTLARLAEQVRKSNMQMYTLFEDYDRVHNGTVSQSQFRRVLSELELGSLVNETEFQVLYKKFDVKVGGKDDINYIAFCDTIYQMAKIELFRP